jgi:hypothetical protein
MLNLLTLLTLTGSPVLTRSVVSPYSNSNSNIIIISFSIIITITITIIIAIISVIVINIIIIISIIIITIIVIIIIIVIVVEVGIITIACGSRETKSTFPGCSTQSAVRCYTIVTLLLHCYKTVVTLLLHYYFPSCSSQSTTFLPFSPFLISLLYLSRFQTLMALL